MSDIERTKWELLRMAKRCPNCYQANFTTTACGVHKCLTNNCGYKFDDMSALPSIAQLEEMIDVLEFKYENNS